MLQTIKYDFTCRAKYTQSEDERTASSPTSTPHASGFSFPTEITFVVVMMRETSRRLLRNYCERFEVLRQTLHSAPTNDTNS
ncbi:hypothetical protein L596_001625 [Steinernema carpocapsae]|uniref:Uncharacterized protein n=1 Tax=Steinernema carpocapsae TaxID=34508 RepID=A0A4U8UPE5_STECR|nr:hypothetical protein L596_001625 [Steinernema carpocapsae]